MKKLIAGLCVLTVCIFTVFAAMDTVVYSLGANTGVNTSTASYVVRGTIESIYVDITAGTTSTVTVADSYGTVFSQAAIIADAQFFPRVAGQTTAGTALTMTLLGSNNDGATSNTVTSASGGIGGCQKIAVAGDVTVTVVNAIETTATNTPVITLIVDK